MFATVRQGIQLSPFHGGNTSSNLVRDAKEIKELKDFLTTLSNICPIYRRGCGWTPVDMEEAIQGAKQRCRRPRVSSIEAPTGIAGPSFGTTARSRSCISRTPRRASAGITMVRFHRQSRFVQDIQATVGNGERKV